jgi:hypothetical protein
MKQIHECAGLSVEGPNIGAFPRVASKTGVGEVVRIGLPTVFSADNVVDLMS